MEAELVAGNSLYRNTDLVESGILQEYFPAPLEACENMRPCGEGHRSKDNRLVDMSGKILDQSGEVHEKD